MTISGCNCHKNTMYVSLFIPDITELKIGGGGAMTTNLCMSGLAM